MKEKAIGCFISFWKQAWIQDAPIQHLKEKKENDKSGWFAWDYCYSAFQSARENKGTGGYDSETLCLHLTAYLASWGMYRGSSFLKNYNYLVHENVIDIVLCDRYRCLEGIALDGYDDDEKMGLLQELYEKIAEKAYNKGDIPTDTLVSKILLGTMACIPAYDTYTKKALCKFDIKRNLTVIAANRIETIRQLREFHDFLYGEELKKITDHLRKYNCHPDMKILDLLLVTYGEYLEYKDYIGTLKTNPPPEGKKQKKLERFSYIVST